MNDKRREGSALEHAVHKAEDIAGGLVGRASAKLNDRATDFIQGAAISDMYEVEAGRLAVHRTNDPDIRLAAERMVADHLENSKKLRSVLSLELKGALPMGLDPRRQMMMQHLQEASDEDFDKTYLDQQVSAHKEAVTLMHHFRDNGDNEALRNFASTAAPVIEDHLEMMERLASK